MRITNTRILKRPRETVGEKKNRGFREDRAPTIRMKKLGWGGRIKQTASRYAFLRGVTVNDTMSLTTVRGVERDSALIYDVECAAAIFIKRICPR